MLAGFKYSLKQAGVALRHQDCARARYWIADAAQHFVKEAPPLFAARSAVGRQARTLTRAQHLIDRCDLKARGAWAGVGKERNRSEQPICVEYEKNRCVKYRLGTRIIHVWNGARKPRRR